MAISEVYTGVLTRHAGTLTATARWTGTDGVFHEDYPVNGAGVAQDAGVLAEIEDVLAALADVDAFANGFESGGLFAAVNTDAEGDMVVDPFPSPSAIFERPRGKLSIVSAATDFTRLGAWSHQVSANAVSALSAQEYTRDDRGQELGAFAYSPLDPTAAYTSVTSRLYPARGASGKVTASYAGETVAAQPDLFYKGAVEATVFWDPTTVTDSKIRITISDLAETETDAPLEFGSRVKVESLQWTADIETEDGVLKFSTSNPVSYVGTGLEDVSPYKPDYDDQLRFEFVLTALGGGQNQNDYRFGANGDNYIELQASVSRNWGALTLRNVRQGGATRAANTADLTQFALDQEMLRMPKWVVQGPRVNTSTSDANAFLSWVFVFADGSMLHFSQQQGGSAVIVNPVLYTPWKRAIGIDTAKNPDSMYAVSVAGDPALSANNNQYFFTRPGSADAAGYPQGGGAVSTGQPSMTPAQLYATYLADGGYVDRNDTTALASELEGMFVGQDADGPLGLIGNWTLTGDAFGVGDTRGPIRGAFGADFQP